VNKKNIKKVLITGSSGMLGGAIFDLFLSNDEMFDVLGIDKVTPRIDNGFHVKINLIDFKQLQSILNDFKPDIIIHCAAIVNVDCCETDKKSADLLHIEVTKILGSYNAKKSRLIYISTDAVFDGVNGNYRENDKPHPLNYYAKSKWRGETEALNSCENNLVVRTNIYGYKNPPGNSLAEWAIHEAKNKKMISGFSDVYFNPLYVKQLARVIKHLIIRSENGVIHAGTREAVTKFEFLMELYRRFGFPANRIKPISIDEIEFKGARPKNTTLNVNRLKEITGDAPSIYNGLDEFVNDYKKDGRMNHD